MARKIKYLKNEYFLCKNETFFGDFQALCNAVLDSYIVAKMEIYVRKVVLEQKFNLLREDYQGFEDTKHTN